MRAPQFKDGPMLAGPILLVEDNDDDIVLTLRAMKKSQITTQIVVTRDGAEALEYIFGAGAYTGTGTTSLPSIVLLDLKLPRIDGMETLSHLRANELTRLMPVIILTSSDEQRDIKECYRLGANSYLRKSGDFAEFTKLMGTLHTYWQANEIATLTARS